MPTNRSSSDAEKALKLAEEAETFALLAPEEERAKIDTSLASSTSSGRAPTARSR